MKRFKEARDRGGAYLLSMQRPDGSLGDPVKGVTEYYKAPTALLVCGESSAANRLCDWVRKNGMTPDGDFGPRPNDAEEDYFYTYYNSWIVTGAHRLGQFDLAEAGMEFLMDFWDPESGGFYSSATERDDETLEDLWVVSGCGLAALYTGRTDIAIGVGRWMRRMIDAQPDYPKKMYTVYSRARGLHTDAAGKDLFRYVLDGDTSRDQSFYHPGIAGGFLTRLYQATDEDEWLDLAKRYMLFAEGVGDYHFGLLRAGKVGWAASVLYTLTGELKYRDMAVRVGDNLMAVQTEDGAWLALDEERPDIDMTAEMTVWLDEIYQAVGHE
jgi:hypothetical protein